MDIVAGRPTCSRCRKARSTCFCERIRPFASEPRFVLLVHPRENKKRTGTARLTHLCLSNSLLFDGMDFSADPRVAAITGDPSLFPVMLYPGEGARDITAVADAAAFRATVPKGRQLVVFIVDGTWYWAKKMVAANPWLLRLPMVRFTPHTPSAYGFRRQPRPECYSTAESAHFIIDRLGTGGTAHHNLLEVFKAMAQQQGAFGPGV